jgi:hypothetical protein
MSLLVQPDHRDFSILRPLWLAVASFAVIAFLFGLLVPVVAERLRSFYETTPLRFPHLLAFAPMLLLLPGFPFLIAGRVVGVMYTAVRAAPTPRWLITAARIGLLAATIALTINGIAQITRLEARDPRPADFIEPVFD